MHLEGQGIKSKLNMKTRPTSLSTVLTVVLFCFSVQAQQPPEPGLRQPCSHAWRITPADPKPAEKSDAWTGAKSEQDGILSLSYCWAFQPGLTTVKRIPKEGLMLPPAGFDVHRHYAELVGEKIRSDALPVGFSIYKDLAFELETKAIADPTSVTLRLPSVKSEDEFKKLFLLYLDEDWMDPGVLRWQEYPEYLGVQTSDFKSRTLTAGFHYASVFHRATGTGRLMVASFNQEEYDKSAVDLFIASVVGPPYVKVGETFSYSISISNSGATGRPATDVVVHSTITNGGFVSSTASQGSCRHSVNP